LYPNIYRIEFTEIPVLCSMHISSYYLAVSSYK